MRANLDATNGAVIAERATMLAARTLGRDTAHRLVKRRFVRDRAGSVCRRLCVRLRTGGCDVGKRISRAWTIRPRISERRRRCASDCWLGRTDHGLRDLDGFRCYYRIEGRADRPVVVLSHSLGLDHTMWDPQMPALLTAIRVLRYDLRGHGASDAPAGDYTVERLGNGRAALLERLGLTDIAWCGRRSAGWSGSGWRCTRRIGCRRSCWPTRRRASRIPAGMEARRQTVLSDGMAAVEDMAMTRFFGRASARREPAARGVRARHLLCDQPAGYAGCCAALRDFDGTAALARIQTRTLDRQRRSRTSRCRGNRTAPC